MLNPQASAPEPILENVPQYLSTVSTITFVLGIDESRQPAVYRLQIDQRGGRVAWITVTSSQPLVVEEGSRGLNLSVTSAIPTVENGVTVAWSYALSNGTTLTFDPREGHEYRVIYSGGGTIRERSSGPNVDDPLDESGISENSNDANSNSSVPDVNDSIDKGLSDVGGADIQTPPPAATAVDNAGSVPTDTSTATRVANIKKVLRAYPDINFL